MIFAKKHSKLVWFLHALFLQAQTAGARTVATRVSILSILCSGATLKTNQCVERKAAVHAKTWQVWSAFLIFVPKL